MAVGCAGLLAAIPAAAVLITQQLAMQQQNGCVVQFRAFSDSLPRLAGTLIGAFNNLLPLCPGSVFDRGSTIGAALLPMVGMTKQLLHMAAAATAAGSSAALELWDTVSVTSFLFAYALSTALKKEFPLGVEPQEGSMHTELLSAVEQLTLVNLGWVTGMLYAAAAAQLEQQQRMQGQRCGASKQAARSTVAAASSSSAAAGGVIAAQPTDLPPPHHQQLLARLLGCQQVFVPSSLPDNLSIALVQNVVQTALAGMRPGSQQSCPGTAAALHSGTARAGVESSGSHGMGKPGLQVQEQQQCAQQQPILQQVLLELLQLAARNAAIVKSCIDLLQLLLALDFAKKWTLPAAAATGGSFQALLPQLLTELGPIILQRGFQQVDSAAPASALLCSSSGKEKQQWQLDSGGAANCTRPFVQMLMHALTPTADGRTDAPCIEAVAAARMEKSGLFATGE